MIHPANTFNISIRTAMAVLFFSIMVPVTAFSSKQCNEFCMERAQTFFSGSEVQVWVFVLLKTSFYSSDLDFSSPGCLRPLILRTIPQRWFSIGSWWRPEKIPKWCDLAKFTVSGLKPWMRGLHFWDLTTFQAAMYHLVWSKTLPQLLYLKFPVLPLA